MKEEDKIAFQKEYEKIHTSLMRFCMVKSRGLMEPEDLLNEVLLVGLENFHKLENKKALLSYLFTTANRIAANKIRRKKFAGHYEESQAIAMIDSSASPEILTDIQLLYAALDELPPLQKEAVVLFEISDLPIKAIMEIQNAKSSTVKQRIKRGREKLAEILQEDEQRKKAGILVSATVLMVNHNLMAQPENLFNAFKEIPLPVSHEAAQQTIISYTAKGAAIHSSGTKLGFKVIKNIVIKTVFIGGIVTGAWLTSGHVDSEDKTTSNKSIPEKNAMALSTVLPFNFGTNSHYENSTIDLKTKDQKVELKPIDHLPTRPQTNENPFIGEIIQPTHKLMSLATTDVSPQNFPEEELVGNTFNLDGIQTVKIDNIGDYLEIKSWDKNSVEVLSNHTIVGKTPEDEELIRQNTTFTAIRKGNVLVLGYGSCTTINRNIGMGKANNTIKFANGDKARFKELELRYTLMIPNNIALDINGHFGTVIIPDVNADLTMNLFDATCTLGNVTGNADIKMHYTKGNIGNLNQASCYFMDCQINLGDVKSKGFNAKYSKINIKNLEMIESKLDLFESNFNVVDIKGDMKANWRYAHVNLTNAEKLNANLTLFESNVNLPSLSHLTLNANYSNLNITKIDQLDCPALFESSLVIGIVNSLEVESSKYTKYHITQLKESMKVNSFEDKIYIEEVDDKVSSLVYNGKYTNYVLKLKGKGNYQLKYHGNYSQLDYAAFKFTTISSDSRNEDKTINGYLQNANENSPVISFDCFESNVSIQK